MTQRIDQPAKGASPERATPVGSDGRDFGLLWAGQATHRIGTEIINLALPLLAVLVMSGTALQVSAIVAVAYLPSLLLGLPAGVLVDRWERRTVLVTADFGRCVVLGSIPLLVWLDAISFPILYVITFVSGVLTLLYDLAYQSMLPRIVSADQLPNANSRLEATRSVAAGLGPLAGGGLVQAIAAPAAILVSGLTYAVSGAFALFIRRVPGTPPAERAPFRTELAEGIRLVLRHPLQLRLAGTALTSNLFAAAIQALYVLFAARTLHLSPSLIGVTFAGGAVGAVAAALATRRIAGRSSPRGVVLSGLTVSGVGYLLVPAANEHSWLAAVAVLTLASALGQGGIVVLAARVMAWRQQITPGHLLARVISFTRTFAFGAMPLGALLGGALAELVGIRYALAVAALGMLSGTLWLIVAPRGLVAAPHDAREER
jgi:MFS family permease